MLVCSKCSSAWPSGTPFCSTCGASLLLGGLMPPIPPPPMQSKMSGMAITGFVLSFVCGLLGLIFSLIGYFDCKKSQGRMTGEGFALAGIVISLVSLVGTVLLWFAVFRAVDSIDKIFDETDARMELRSIADSASESWRKTGNFPTRDHAPKQSCCGEPNNRCRDNFDIPAWQAIGHKNYGSTRYRLGYESTATTFTAIALGDLDCDGNEVTFRLSVELVRGRPITGTIERSGED
jgi:hypothetical protein